jgi:hypothetical protein
LRWRRTPYETAGPVEHVKVSCLDRHRFLIPAFTLDQAGHLDRAGIQRLVAVLSRLLDLATAANATASGGLEFTGAGPGTTPGRSHPGGGTWTSAPRRPRTPVISGRHPCDRPCLEAALFQ